MSDRAEQMAQGTLFVISAPSGAGKTSLTRAVIDRLAAEGIEACFSVSHTTRAAREGERDGVDYHFVSEADFRSMAARGEFLEHAEVFGRCYGTGRRKTLDLLAQGKDVMLDIDWQGAAQVRERMPESVGVFILPPSRRELENRLRARAQDKEEVICRRMRQATDEMGHHDEYDYLIVNDEFQHAGDGLYAICRARRLRREAQVRQLGATLEKLLAGP